MSSRKRTKTKKECKRIKKDVIYQCSLEFESLHAEDILNDNRNDIQQALTSISTSWLTPAHDEVKLDENVASSSSSAVFNSSSNFPSSRIIKRCKKKHLNDDCLHLIFAFLDYKELRKCQQVCNKWNRLISRILIGRLRFGRLYVRQVNSAIRCENVFQPLEFFEPKTWNDLQAMLGLARQVEHLKIQVPSSRYLFSLKHLQAQQELRFLCLELNSDKCFTSPRLLHQLSHQNWCPQLHTLLIKCENYQWLEHNHNLLRLLAAFPKLEVVKVRNLQFVAQISTSQANTVWTPPKQLCSIRTLSLKSCKFLSEQDFNFFTHFPGLQTLQVGHVYWQLLLRMMSTWSTSLLALRITQLNCPNWTYFKNFLFSVCRLQQVREIVVISTKLFVGPRLRNMLQSVFNSCESLQKLEVNHFEVLRSNPQAFERFVRFIKRKGEVITNAVNAYRLQPAGSMAQTQNPQQEHLSTILRRTKTIRISAKMNLTKFQTLLPTYFDQLRSISITFDAPNVDELLIHLMRKPLPKVKRLELRNTNRVTDASLCQIPIYFSSLQWLSVQPTQMVSKVTDRTWKALLQLQQFRELYIKRLQVKPSSFFRLIRNSQTLYVVECCECRGINQSTVESCIAQKMAQNPLLDDTSLLTKPKLTNPFNVQ